MFLKRKTKSQKKFLDFNKKKTPFYQRRGWKIFFIILAIFLISGGSFLFYLASTGSKIFEKGLSGFMTNGKDGLRGSGADRVNILLLGMGGPNHPGGLLSDSIMIASFKPSEKKVALISIPRDLYVPIRNHDHGKINEAFSHGYNDYLSKECKQKNRGGCVKDAMSAGGNLSRRTVEEISGLEIPYYFTVQFKSFETLIDQLGGIDVYVDKAINDPMFPSDDMVNYTTFSIGAGNRHLDGATALKYARSRETTSDFDRSARQQKVLSAIWEKASKLNLLTDSKKVLDIFSSLTDSLYTNFEPGELKPLLQMVKDSDLDNIISKVLSNGNDGPLVSVNNGTFYLKPKSGDYSVIKEIFGGIFSTKQSAKVEIANGAKVPAQKLEQLKKELEENDEHDLSVLSVYANKSVEKTTIYDYTGGSKNSILENLKSKFNAATAVKIRPSDSSADFVVILGKDYDATN